MIEQSEQPNINEVRELRLIHLQETAADGTSCGLTNPSPQSSLMQSRESGHGPAA